MMRTTGSLMTGTTPRRMLASRNAGWARSLARMLANCGVQPNAVSLAGIAFALGAGLAFVVSPACGSSGRSALLLAAAVCVQLRLLCNLLDGMLALEEGLKTPTGEIFNDLPDRFEDILILVGAGYAPGFPAAAALGWAAAIAAVLTAYVRVLGGSLGLAQHFAGPMAKQHRMFVLTLFTVIAAIERVMGLPARALPVGLAIVVIGSAATALRRTRRILREAEAR